MKLPWKQHHQTGGWLCVEPLAAETESLYDRVTAQDRSLAAAIASPTRRRETLAWRALLYRELGPKKITYAPCGAPELAEGEGFIGVSHSRHSVALCYSPTHPCAVDIESADRNFERLIPRYLTPGEQQLCSHPAYACIAWCAKECLYKLARRRELNLTDDLQILEITFTTPDSGSLACRLMKEPHTLHFRRIGREWVVWKL